MILSRRTISIMKYLLNNHSPISSDVLASALGTTSKTVRADIKLIDEILKKVGAKVVSKSGIGYNIEIFNKSEFLIFLDSFNEKYYTKISLPTYNIERINFIINQLLTEENYIKSEEFINQLYISRTLLTQDLKKVRQILKKYHLELLQKPNFGMKIKGTEIHKRVAMLDYIFLDEDISILSSKRIPIDIDLKLCTDVLVKYLQAKDIHVPYKYMQDTALLISISDFRIKRNHNVVLNKLEIEEIMEFEEYDVATNVCRDLNIITDERERCFIALYIASRRTYYGNEANKFELSKNKSLYFLCDELLRIIYIYTNINFLMDNFIREELTKELRGMLLRLGYGLEYKTMPMEEIKIMMPTFGYAELMADYLEKRYGYIVPADEIGGLALILQQSLSKYNLNYKKQRVCLVFNRGPYSAYGIQNILQKNFQEYIEYIGICEFHEVNDDLLHRYDLIVTDMPRIKFNYDIPILQVLGAFGTNEMLQAKRLLLRKDEEYAFLADRFKDENFFKDLDVHSKKEALERICNKLEDNLEISNIFKSVMSQEKIISSEQGNNIAIPHTLYTVTKYSQVALATLKRPILWDDEMVQIIFLIINGQDERYTYMTVSLVQSIVNDVFVIHDLLNAKDVNDLKNIMYKKIVLDK